MYYLFIPLHMFEVTVQQYIEYVFTPCLHLTPSHDIVYALVIFE